MTYNTPSGEGPDLGWQEMRLARVRSEHARYLGPLAPRALAIGAQMRAERLAGGLTPAEYALPFREGMPLVTRSMPKGQGVDERPISLEISFVGRSGDGAGHSFMAVVVGDVSSLEPETLLGTQHTPAEGFEVKDLDVVYPLAHELHRLRTGAADEVPELPNLSPDFHSIVPDPYTYPA